MPNLDDDYPVPPLDEPDTDGKHAPKVSAETRRKQSDAAKARGAKRDASGHFVGARKSKALDGIRNDVATTVAGVGSVLIPTGLPLSGGVLVDTSPRWGDAVAAIAEANPRVLAMLEKSTGYVAWAQLATLGATFGVAVAVEMGRIPVDSSLPRNLGVTAVYDTLVESGEIAPAVPMTEATSVADNPAGADERTVPAPDLLGAGTG